MGKKASAYSQFLNELGGDEQAQQKEPIKPTVDAAAKSEEKKPQEAPELPAGQLSNPQGHLESIDQAIKESGGSDQPKP